MMSDEALVQTFKNATRELAELEVRRDQLVEERRLVVEALTRRMSYRAVGKLLGISAPRVGQIKNFRSPSA